MAAFAKTSAVIRSSHHSQYRGHDSVLQITITQQKGPDR
jgi:hypothetical protein